MTSFLLQSWNISAEEKSSGGTTTTDRSLLFLKPEESYEMLSWDSNIVRNSMCYFLPPSRIYPLCSIPVHHQGIIHRDIKPANLLWTEDRRQVKISDFGVSHFSYAQRLAAAGGKDVQCDPADPLLLDDSSLTRRAGTPSFLAPEIIYEHKDVTSPSSSSSIRVASSSSSLHTVTTTPILNSTDRPEITKSIDVWALGVTFYCLLFGTTPWLADTGTSGTGSEFTMYNAICNTDWTVPSTMGYNKIPTGGRQPDPDCEGASIIGLLDRFLQKDYKTRITLDQVKVRILNF